MVSQQERLDLVMKYSVVLKTKRNGEIKREKNNSWWICLDTDRTVTRV